MDQLWSRTTRDKFLANTMHMLFVFVFHLTRFHHIRNRRCFFFVTVAACSGHFIIMSHVYKTKQKKIARYMCIPIDTDCQWFSENYQCTRLLCSIEPLPLLHRTQSHPFALFLFIFVAVFFVRIFGSIGTTHACNVEVRALVMPWQFFCPLSLNRMHRFWYLNSNLVRHRHQFVKFVFERKSPLFRYQSKFCL